ncbi:dipeptide epimerase [bacterium]|nr:dipeptide epimerase [bacterium]
MATATSIARVDAAPLDVPMRAPFAIAGGAALSAANVLVRVRLSGGSVGWGEGAPLAAFNGETQESVLAAVRAAAPAMIGRDAGDWLPVLRSLDEDVESGCARAALSMAVLDAWTRSIRIPLRRLFGGATDAVRSDVTVDLVNAREAEAAARRIRRLGVGIVKIKVGAGLAEDEERVRGVARGAPGAALFLDANQAYDARTALVLLRRLRLREIVPVLFEQPVPADDWEGLGDVHRLGRVRVAADESVASRSDALRMARLRRAQVVNVKLMKTGLLESWDVARICAAAGLGLMVGAMVETPLALAAAAHLAAGLGGFEFVDLDTALWLARDPMRGPSFGPGGTWDLSGVTAGIGVVPRHEPRA